ncbi:MAG TPA: LLM class flavin-dependent oxidoreductase [Acidimicrobiales bacterium]|nr:LLM class flavin-dependent oxidoreductase [Acidimicrobiales bacterium]
MDHALRLSVELPPVPASGPVPLERWWEAGAAALAAGADVIWFTGGSQDGDPAAPSAAWCDACTIAASSMSDPRLEGAVLGVVSVLPLDRHPAVLARDVTTLDVLSNGRAATLLRWDDGGASGRGDPAGLPGVRAATDYLGEAVAVCRAVLCDDDPVFEGRFLHVAGAVNRPPPSRPSGPPLFVEVPSGAASVLAEDPAASLLLRQSVAAGATIVCDDEPGEVAEWRAILETAARESWTGRDADRTEVVCRATVPPVADPSASRVHARARAVAAHAAGAGGVVVPLPAIGRADDTGVAGDLAGWFEPWRG